MPTPHSRNLAAALTLSAATLASHAQIVANFDGGNGTASADQFVGVAADGWLTPWNVAGTSTSQTVTYSVIDTTPLSPGGGNYLNGTLTVNDDTGSGQSRSGVVRRYDAAALGNEITTSFLLRIDAASGFNNEFNDTIYLTESNNLLTSSGGSNTNTTWQINLRGNGRVSYNNGTTSTTLPNTGPNSLTWTTGDLFSFNIVSDAATETWSFIVQNLTQGQSASVSGAAWRAAATLSNAHGSHFNVVPGIARGTGQTGSSISISLDSVSIIPEPSTTAALAALGAAAAALALLRRRS